MNPATGAVSAGETAPLRRRWSPAPGLQLCLVSVPAFLVRYLPMIRFGDGLARLPVPLSAFVCPLEFLSPEERAQVERFASLKKQVEWLCGRLAAKTAVAAAAGVGLDLKHIGLAYEKEGAPYVRALPDLPLSISHSGAWAGAVVGGRGRIGLDMERISPDDLQFLLKAGFTQGERSALVGASPETVIRHWTLKEAFLKFIGKGFNESLAAVEVIDSRLHHHGRPIENLTVIQNPLGRDYMMSLVFAESDDWWNR